MMALRTLMVFKSKTIASGNWDYIGNKNYNVCARIKCKAFPVNISKIFDNAMIQTQQQQFFVNLSNHFQNSECCVLHVTLWNVQNDFSHIFFPFGC